MGLQRVGHDWDSKHSTAQLILSCGGKKKNQRCRKVLWSDKCRLTRKIYSQLRIYCHWSWCTASLFTTTIKKDLLNESLTQTKDQCLTWVPLSLLNLYVQVYFHYIFFLRVAVIKTNVKHSHQPVWAFDANVGLVNVCVVMRIQLLSCVRLFGNLMDCSPPARLLRPCDSPGKNTGVGCHSLLQGIFPT